MLYRIIAHSDDRVVLSTAVTRARADEEAKSFLDEGYTGVEITKLVATAEAVTTFTITYIKEEQ